MTDAPKTDAPKTKTRSPEEPPRKPAPAPRDAASQRRFEGRAHVTLGSVLVVLIAVMTCYLAYRHYRRFDWTSEGVFTLSDRTRAVLAELDRDVDVYMVMSSGEPSYQDIRDLLERYRAEQQRLTLHFVDPDRQTAEYRLIAERFDLGLGQTESGALASDVSVVLSAGDRVWKIDQSDLVEVDLESFADDGEGELDVHAEQAITGGILEVTAGRRTKVCITQGHGEWTLSAGAERDLQGLADEMRRDNLELEAFETRGAPRVPEGCDAVFVVAPTTAFTSDEAALIRSYVEGGGNLLVAADPEIERESIAPIGLEDVLRDWGIRVDRALVLEIDPRLLPPSSTNPAGPFAVASWGDHDLTRAYRSADVAVPMIVDMVRPVRAIDPDRATMLFETSESAFGETDIARLISAGEPMRDDADVPGPVSLAVATRVERMGEAPDDEGEAPEAREGGRVIVVGDADFLDSRYLAAAETVNYPIASGIVGWLTARAALIELPGRRVSARAVRMSEEDVTGLFFRVVVLLPAAVIFLGIAVWWNRRS